MAGAAFEPATWAGVVYPAAPEPQEAVDLWSIPDDRTLAALLDASRAREVAAARVCLKGPTAT